MHRGVSRRLGALAIIIVGHFGLSACATGELHAANRAAGANVTALALTTNAYDATRQPRIDAESISLTTGRRDPPPPLTRGVLEARDMAEARAQGDTAILRDHAALLTAYFTALKEFTEPGSNSATKATDVQLANSAGIVGAINRLHGNPALNSTVSAIASQLLSANAQRELREHLNEHGATIAIALQYQVNAMAQLEARLEQNRESSCNDAMFAFEAANTPASGGRTYTPAEATAFAAARRAALTCQRGASEARQARAGLEASRAAYIELLGFDPPMPGPLRPEDRTRFIEAIVALNAARAPPEATPTHNGGQ